MSDGRFVVRRWLIRLIGGIMRLHTGAACLIERQVGAGGWCGWFCRFPSSSSGRSSPVEWMQLFVQQVQFSFSVEVLEAAWNDFQGNLAKARSLDDILVFHNDYLTVVEEKCFIQSKTHKNILVRNFFFVLSWLFSILPVAGTGYPFTNGVRSNCEVWQLLHWYSVRRWRGNESFNGEPTGFQ